MRQFIAHGTSDSRGIEGPAKSPPCLAFFWAGCSPCCPAAAAAAACATLAATAAVAADIPAATSAVVADADADDDDDDDDADDADDDAGGDDNGVFPACLRFLVLLSVIVPAKCQDLK
jgi:hypothetical protein